MRRGVIVSKLSCDLSSLKEDDYIIACDAGYLNFKDIDRKPDLVIGDFDSLAIENLAENQKFIHLPKEKDVTDTEYALSLLLKEGFDEICLFGALGGRLDMSLVTISLLYKVSKLNKKIYAFKDDEIVFPLYNSMVEFKKEAKGVISVFSLSETSKGVDEIYLKYPLSNYELRSDEPLGVSNEFIGKKSIIRVKEGALLVITNKDNL